ncbi:hypothetical protein EJ02DRAFT_456029 [Clathrospora elynae]|uniref:Uncharacterized protein n=1 Tax=Clathrospora elynae TaxID=706981 RepID=A0A6A5SLT2_9PLEO|nr:hypothetical protein EJ02DRAFT_456029 [Clathrospora elynae]
MYSCARVLYIRARWQGLKFEKTSKRSIIFEVHSLGGIIMENGGTNDEKLLAYAWAQMREAEEELG